MLDEELLSEDEDEEDTGDKGVIANEGLLTNSILSPKAGGQHL